MREFKITLADIISFSEPDLEAHFPEALAGGKMIRGCLSCMVSDALGGSFDQAIPRAVAIELIHCATLIHDDFVDQDTIRRSHPALWTLYGARKAVLLGDVIFATAIKNMSDLGRDEGVLVSDAIAKISAGAFREPIDASKAEKVFRANGGNQLLYEQIIHLKTGVLFAAACEIGAIAAEAKAGMRARAYHYGMRIGEAYQIADDLMEVHELLARGIVRPHQITLLAPALLYFDHEIKRLILPLLQKEAANLKNSLRSRLEGIRKAMQGEVERRLKDAVAPLDGGAPVNAYHALMRNAPGELIRMLYAS
jgi:hypothetical protein